MKSKRILSQDQIVSLNTPFGKFYKIGVFWYEPDLKTKASSICLNYIMKRQRKLS